MKKKHYSLNKFNAKRILSVFIALAILNTSFQELLFNSNNSSVLANEVTTEILLGDVNKDENINILDGVLMKNRLLKASNTSDIQNIDLNGDSNFSKNDLDYMNSFLLNGIKEFPAQSKLQMNSINREILSSSQPIETSISKEIGLKAKELGTPLEIYKYIKNNINYEFYGNSRKGAIGTFEQFGGNDIDQASLFISMLRHIGYEANYVTGIINLPAEQAQALTLTNDVISAANKMGVQLKTGKILADNNGNYTGLQFEHTWVKVKINNTWIELDPSIKKYENTTSNSYDELSKLNIDYSNFKNINENTINSLNNTETILNSYNNSQFTTKTRSIIKEDLLELPTKLPFIKNSETQNTEYSSLTDDMKDMVTINVGGKTEDGGVNKTLSSAELCLKSVSVEYTPYCSGVDEETLEFLGVSIPSSVFEITGNPYSLTGYTGLYIGVRPTIKLDGKDVAYGDVVFLGTRQNLTISVEGKGYGKYYSIKELTAGAFYNITFDSQNISAQDIGTAFNKLSQTNTGTPNITNNEMYTSKYMGNLLNLIGKTYFAQLDINRNILSNMNNIYSERYLSFCVVSYEPNEIININDYTQFTKSGVLSIDVLGNYTSEFDPTNDTDAIKLYRTSYGFISSSLESKVLEMITGVKSLSTVDIMNLASSQNIELKLISSANSAEIDTLKLDAKSIAEIKSEVAKGNFVNVPQENITVNKWTGTGYIITNPKTYESTYKITGGLNGGTTTSYLTVDYMANICFSVADYAAAFQLLTVSITAILAGGYLVGAIAMVGCVLLLSYAIENYFTSISLMYDSINGDTNAAKELENRAKLNSIFTVIGISSSIISKPIINSIAKTRLAKKAGTTALNVIEKFDTKADEALQKISSIVSKGYDEKTTTALLKDTKFLNYNDDLTYAILKTGKPAEVAETLSKCSDDVIEALNKSPNKDTAISLIAKYGDDAVDIFVKYGDEAVEVIGKYGDDATRIIVDYSDNGFTALKNGITPKQINEIKEIGLTPDDFGGQGKIRNLVVSSSNEADELIKSNRKIHSLFSDDELTALKNNVINYENQYKADFKAKKIDGKATPAVAGVAYRNANGELEFFYGVNNSDGNAPKILKEFDIDSALLKQIKKNFDDLDPSIYAYTAGAGSHAEVYAVCEALQKHPYASIDDFVVYVNYSKPTDKPAVGLSFFTCPHCREILKDLNILSNVEGF